MRYFIKYSTIGIPNRNIYSLPPPSLSTTEWELSLQRHIAKRAGSHLDLRLAPPGGPALSWAGRQWPSPGEKQLFVQQPDHSPEYMDFAGEIEGEGYGAGKVSVERRGKVDVLKSSPDKLTFYYYTGTSTEKYTLLKLGEKDWLLINHTPLNKEMKRLLPEPLKYKTKYVEREGEVSTPKIDGASSITILKGNKFPVVLSKRISKRTGEQIEYTPKIPDLLTALVPKEFGTTVLRTEVFATTPDNKEIPNRLLGGILNSSVPMSRLMQKKEHTPLRVALLDVVRYKGKDYSKVPFKDKQLIMNEIRTKFPYIELPSELAKKIEFAEGRVVWQNGTPIKLKNVSDYDVFVRKVFPSTHAGRAGGFTYSFTPKGKITGKVGTGFTHAELIDMLQNPKAYVGGVARISAQEQFPSKSLRMPVMLSWNWEKSPEKFNRYLFKSYGKI